MPRVGRFEVEFSIASSPDKVWSAQFIHTHAKEHCAHPVLGKTFLHPPRSCPEPRIEPIDYCVKDGPDTGKVVRIKHLTMVKLRYKGSPVFLSGYAPCSLRDEYNWRHGIHFALQRALEKAGYCKLAKVEVCPHFAGPTNTNQLSLHGLQCPSIGKMVVVDKKPIYDEICEAFWREVHIPPPAPEALGAVIGTASMPLVRSSRPDVVHGMGFSEVERTPPQNRSGTAWSGMD